MFQMKSVFRALCVSFLAIILLPSILNLKLGGNILEARADSSSSHSWFYEGWQYRKEHYILYTQSNSAASFYDVSSPWITIAGNPTDRHAFQPVHNTTIVECNVVIDGAVRKYLAYDSDSAGSQIRLYYTDNLNGLWTPYSGNPILSGYLRFRWPSVAYVNGVFHMFLTDRIDGTLERWTSTDGIHYSFVENIKVGGNQWKTPFIWFNPNDNKWYLYTHDATESLEHVKVRSTISIEDLDLASDTVVVSVAAPFGGASVMCSNNTYWLVAELFEGGLWKILAYYSTTSPSSGYSLAANSPILIDDEACPILVLNQDQSKAYLFTNKESSAWYQYTREVYLNSTIFPEAPTLKNYQVKIKTYYGSGFDTGENVYLNMQSKRDFGDVRFTWLNSSSGLEQECSYWMEELRTGESTIFWVKIPEISSRIDNKIYIYYGKTDATSASNAKNTFDLFDDFNGDLTEWTITHYDGTGSASIVNGWARINAQPNGDFWGYVDGASGIFKATPLNDNYVIETMFRQQSYPTKDAHNRFLMSRANLASNSAFYVMLFDDDSSHITTCWRDANGAYTGWAGENTGWSRGSQTTFYARLAKIGSTFYAYISPDGNTWFSAGSRSGSYQGYIGLVDSYHDGYTEFDWVRVRKYVEPEPSHGAWGSEETAEYIVIDKSFISDERADVGSIQTVSFHAKWNNNGSDVIWGSIYVNGTEHITNNTGWISFTVTSSQIGEQEWTITAVNCGGVTAYIQTAPNPTIIWDCIQIINGGATKESAILGETVTIWFQATYEYDNKIFNNANGILYVNNMPMTWSITNNRWEYQYAPDAPGTKTFTISEVQDNTYGLTAINDVAGTQTITVWSTPFSIISNSTITELAFNSTTKTITFTLSGPHGTTGYTNITIAKTLINNITNLTIYLDDHQIEYLATATEHTWLIHFTYTHSTHKVTIQLTQPNNIKSSNPQPETTLLLSGILIIITATPLIHKKVRRKTS